MAKATQRAHKNMRKVSLSGTTIPHEVIAKVGGAEVLLKPASRGTGVIAGGGVRAVVEAAGIHEHTNKIARQLKYVECCKSHLLRHWSSCILPTR